MKLEKGQVLHQTNTKKWVVSFVYLFNAWDGHSSQENQNPLLTQLFRTHSEEKYNFFPKP